MENKNIPINKGNDSMESEEREALFEKYRAEGWENKYYAYRRNWERNAKEHIVSEYPLLVDLELSTACNLHCPMCYTVSKAFKEKVRPVFMEPELFKRVIDEIAGKVPAVRMSLRGEPTIHPEFLNLLRYAKEKEIPEVSFLTNCSKMTPEFFEDVLIAGADWITVSVDGMGEMYESIRKPLVFEETFEKIKAMKKIKEKYNTNRPVIKIQSIWPAIRDNAEAFYNLFLPYVDFIAFNPMSDDLQNDECKIEYIENFSCPQLYQRIIVAADGKVLACSNDEENNNVIGDIHISTIFELWHGEGMERMRRIHKLENAYQNEPVCRKCYLPRKMEIDDVVSINGRKVIAERYTNRSQTIGE